MERSIRLHQPLFFAFRRSNRRNTFRVSLQSKEVGKTAPDGIRILLVTLCPDKKWGCANRIVNGRAVCDSHHINEDVLYATYHAAVKAMIEDAGALLEVIQTETEVEMQPRNKAAMDEVEQQIIELQERVLDLHKQKRAMKISDAYYNAQVNDYSQQLGALESRKQALQTADARYATVRMWLADFRQHMQEGDATDDRDGSIMKTLVEAIIVWDDRIEVRFKCGATVEQKYVA